MSATLEVYRISAPGDGRSMWYDRDGIFRPILPEVEVVPLEIDPFRLDLAERGTWLSGVKDHALLEAWFPGLVPKLTALGFVTRKFIVKHWHELPNEIVFDTGTALEVTE